MPQGDFPAIAGSRESHKGTSCRSRGTEAGREPSPRCFGSSPRLWLVGIYYFASRRNLLCFPVHRSPKLHALTPRDHHSCNPGPGRDDCGVGFDLRVDQGRGQPHAGGGFSRRAFRRGGTGDAGTVSAADVAPRSRADSARPPARCDLWQRAVVADLGAGADLAYKTFSVAGRSAYTTSRWTYEASLRGGTDFGSNAPFYDQFRMGGLFNFAVYQRGELPGREYGFASLLLRRRAAFLNESPGTALYSGGTIEFGNVYKRLDQSPAQGVLTSGSLYLAVDSKIGPVYLAWGLSQGGHSTAYFYIG